MIAALSLVVAYAAIASASPWHHYDHRYHHHHHHNQKKDTSLALTSTESSIAATTSAIQAESSTNFPTLSVSAASGTAYSIGNATASGTSSRSKCRATRPGTAASTGLHPSASVYANGQANSSTLAASSGLAPKVTSNPSAASVYANGQANSSTLAASSGLAPKVTSTSSAVAAATSNLAATTATTTTSSAASSTPYAGFLRGVNIGGWLLLDTTLNANLLSAAGAIDQWTFDSLAGSPSKLADHWDSYFNESDVQLLKSYGINAIKVPVGYWAFDSSGTPYRQGADAYLEKAVGWAQAAGIKVWIDVSNTDSTQTTVVAEVSPDYAQTHSLSILETIATKYGSAAYADTVTAIEIFSSPVALPPSSSTDAISADFLEQAFATIKKAAANPNLQVVAPDASASPSTWQSTAQSLSPTQGVFSVAETMSELSCPCEQQMTQAQHVQAACQRGYNMAGLDHSHISIYVGEFNPATNATMQVEGWTSDVVDDVRKYVEAQLEVFEAYTSGYFFWSWNDDGEEVLGVGWGFKDGIDKGYIPNPLDDPSVRKYPGQCDA